ncbi:MAG: phasin family protein [Pseudomonadota bacterium]
MAKAQSTVFDYEFPKLPDFAQLQADYSRLFGEFGKLLTNGKIPSFDFEAAFASQRKNVEALTQVNQTALESVQTLAKRQAEIAREAVESYTKLVKEIGAANPEDRFAKQAQIAKEIFEQAVANLNELRDIAQKSQDKVASLISKRVSDNLDEVKSVFQAKAPSAGSTAKN